MLHLLNEDGNKELKNRKFPLAKGIRKHLKRTLENYNGDKTVEGYKRLNNVLDMDTISYLEMKRIKNFFDTYEGGKDSEEFILNGGEPMKTWVNNTLNTATTAIEDFKQAKKDAGISNAFIQHHHKDRQTKTKKPTIAKMQTNDVTKQIGDNDGIKYESVSRNKTVIISESQSKMLLKEALKDDIQLNDFLKNLTSLTSFRKRYNYCMEMLGKPQGRGSSRVVFQIDDERVLKLAFNQKGIAQNFEEYNSAADEFGLAPTIYSIGENEEYIVCEFVLPAKQKDFKHCLGIDWNSFLKFLNTCFKERGERNLYSDVYSWDELYEFCENNDQLSSFHEFIANTEVPRGDMMRVVNYGMVLRNGEPNIVILDNGLSDEIWNKYYKRW